MAVLRERLVAQNPRPAGGRVGCNPDERKRIRDGLPTGQAGSRFAPCGLRLLGWNVWQPAYAKAATGSLRGSHDGLLLACRAVAAKPRISSPPTLKLRRTPAMRRPCAPKPWRRRVVPVEGVEPPCLLGDRF